MIGGGFELAPVAVVGALTAGAYLLIRARRRRLDLTLQELKLRHPRLRAELRERSWTLSPMLRLSIEVPGLPPSVRVTPGWQRVPHDGPLVPTGDPVFDRVADVSGVALDVAATFGAGEREAVIALSRWANRVRWKGAAPLGLAWQGSVGLDHDVDFLARSQVRERVEALAACAGILGRAEPAWERLRRNAFEDPEPGVRRQCAKALGTVSRSGGRARAVTMLHELASAAAPDVRLVAARELRVESPELLRELVLDAGMPFSLRVAALHELGAPSEELVVTLLLPALEIGETIRGSADDRARVALLSASGIMGREATAARLAELLAEAQRRSPSEAPRISPIRRLRAAFDDATVPGTSFGEAASKALLHVRARLGLLEAGRLSLADDESRGSLCAPEIAPDGSLAWPDADAGALSSPEE